MEKLSLPEFASDLCASQLVNNPDNSADLLADKLAELYNKEMLGVIWQTLPGYQMLSQVWTTDPVVWRQVSIQPKVIQGAGEKIP